MVSYDKLDGQWWLVLEGTGWLHVYDAYMLSRWMITWGQQLTAHTRVHNNRMVKWWLIMVKYNYNILQWLIRIANGYLQGITHHYWFMIDRDCCQIPGLAWEIAGLVRPGMLKLRMSYDCCISQPPWWLANASVVHQVSTINNSLSYHQPLRRVKQ